MATRLGLKGAWLGGKASGSRRANVLVMVDSKKPDLVGGLSTEGFVKGLILDDPEG